MAAVAAMPSITGIRMSISTTSGRSSRVLSTASAPFSASATTRMSGVVSSVARSPARISRSSSAVQHADGHGSVR